MQHSWTQGRLTRRALRGVVVAITLTATLLPLTPVWMTAPVAAQEKLQPKLDGSEGGSAPAAATEPVVVVTLGSINQLTQDLNYISGAVGQPQLGGMFAMMAGTLTQGIDTDKPIGILVPLIDGTPEPIAMLPTADVRTVLKRLEAQTGPADELDDGTLVIAIGANTVFIRQMGNWAALARNRNVLDNVPGDPSAIISEMGSDYDLAVRLDMQQIPPEVRDALIGQLRQGFDQAMARQGGDDAETAREYAEQSMEQLEQVISQTDDLMIGLDIDSIAKKIELDFSFTAIPGSKLATIYSGTKPIPSAFSMVIRDDAAAHLHLASSVSPEVIEQARGGIENSLQMVSKALGEIDELSEADQADAKEMIERIAELVLASYEEGKIDAGALLLTDVNEMKFVGGLFVSDGAEAASIVKDIAAKVESRGDAPRFEFDRDTYKGVTLHLIEADVPAEMDEVRKVFGETVRLHIGTAAKAVYVALGDASLPLMMEMVDAAAEPGVLVGDSLGQFDLNLMPILQFAQSVEANDAIATMIDALSRADDAGNLRIVSKSIENGQASHFEIGDGMLRAIGAAFRQAQMKKMQNGGF